MTEIATMVGGLIVSAVVVILTAILLVKLFSRSGLRDNTNNGVAAGAGGLPFVPIPNTSYSSSPGCWKYDVFLSFRGEDTRKTFVDHIYSALEQHNILTYKDDVTLDRGDIIGPSLLKAIQESQILVIIFSENYADSSWCLDELSHIMKCRDSETGQIVFPIFYHVDPSHVRKQKGKYQEAFAKHELSINNNKKKVESWKKALVDASNIAGWEPKHVANGHEAKCIREIVDSILVKLSSLESEAVEDEDLVGMGTRLKDLKRVLRIGSGGVRMVGIWGLGGGGKTTLATSIYMELKVSGKFHGCCFIENIREESKQQNGLKSLQEKILSAVFDKKMQVESVELGKHTSKGMLRRRNVLIVLDDVDDLEQLEALAGRHDWFGDGSRIIITTRNKQLLISHRVDEVYPVSLLSRDEAIRLFRRHAYEEHNPVEDYEKLSLRVISYVNGLPLALKILGAFLYGKDKDEWISTLARLKDHPEMDIVEKLKISYDGLKPVEKELFLDIACFYRRTTMKDRAMEMLDACGFHPHIGVKVLIQKALITVTEGGLFDMHDLVLEMAHYIVRGEHPNNPEKHSRIWRDEDFEDICLRNATAENDKIEAIQYFADVRLSDFIMLVSNMKKLRFLKVDNMFIRTYGEIMLALNMKKLRFLKVDNMFIRTYGEGPSFLSNELRYIHWSGYPASPFPESFQPTKLAVLKMQSSLQKELWKGYKYLPCLRELELIKMEALVRTPDFGGLPCLQRLILINCESLEEIQGSLGNHKSLISVEVSGCKKLSRFPGIVGMEKLEIPKFSSSTALVEFPKIEAKMDNLAKLELGEYCTNLISLNLERAFPRSLRKLNLSWCRLKDGEIPTEIGELFSLQELNLSSNCFTRLDFSLSRLTRLKLLDLSLCLKLVELPELPSSLAILEAKGCYSLEAVIRDEIHTNCKWLSQVSMVRWGKDIIGGERLLETMLQGNAAESRCMLLEVKGLEIPRGFEPRLFKGRRCGMQLPENWDNHFFGFLFCVVSDDYISDIRKISMKHEGENGGWMGMGDDDSQHDSFLYWEEEDSFNDDDDDDEPIGIRDESDDVKERYTWVGYIPFSLLRHTLWWDPTSTAIHIEMDKERKRIIGCGLKLVPKRGGTESSSSGQMEATPHSSSSSSEIPLDHYKCDFHIFHDSKSELKCGVFFSNIYY